LSEIIRLIDGPLAPFGDAEQLRVLIDRDADHSKLYKVFLEVRDAAAKILENTTLADLITDRRAAGSRKASGIRIKSGAARNSNNSKKTGKKKRTELTLMPIMAQGEGA
jgi:DNA-binding IscR family transcriptional regulator